MHGGKAVGSVFGHGSAITSWADKLQDVTPTLLKKK